MLPLPMIETVVMVRLGRLAVVSTKPTVTRIGCCVNYLRQTGSMTSSRWLDERARAWVRLGSLIQRAPTQLRRDPTSRTSSTGSWRCSPGARPHAAHDRAAERTSATLSRLSHVVSRMEERGLVERARAPRTAAPPTRLPPGGLAKLVETAPGHVGRRELARTTAQQVDQLTEITEAMLLRRPDATRTGHIRRT